MTTTTYARSGRGQIWQTLNVIFAFSQVLIGFVGNVNGNTASILKASGFSNIGLSDQNWSILMLLIGGLIAAFVTLRNRGNVGYALTVIWALIGVVVANVVRTPSIPVAVVAGSMAVLVTFALLRTRLFERLSVA